MRRHRGRGILRVVAVLALFLAFADGFRWGNRWYISTMFEDSSPEYALEIIAKAHDALVHGLIWLVVAALAAAVGWRLRVVRRPA
ncbi:hypothetical protein ACFQ80_22100 [Isoptericola sp. NPDC056578]|uniref:hypothetical protein n=1 Tax=Isoptericola sp. NPDC056578 TaxID=3345870 RepID=UPI0036778787